MGIGSRLGWLGAAAILLTGAAQAQTPPNQELAGTARRPPTVLPALAENPIKAGSLCVPFRNGSAELTPTATRALDAFGRRTASSGTLRIEGFADTSDTRDAGRDLARRRAEAVVNYLATLGIDRMDIAVQVRAAPYARRVKIREESK